MAVPMGGNFIPTPMLAPIHAPENPVETHFAPPEFMPVDHFARVDYWQRMNPTDDPSRFVVLPEVKVSTASQLRKSTADEVRHSISSVGGP